MRLYDGAVPKPPAPLNPQPLDFSLPVGEITGGAAVQFEEPEGLVVVQPEKRSGHQVRLRLSRSRHMDPVFVEAPATRELGDVLLATLPHKPLRAFAIPGGRLKTRYHLTRPLIRAIITMTALALLPLILVLITQPALRAFLAAAALMAAVGAWLINAGNARPSEVIYVTADGQYPFATLLEDRPGIDAARRLVEQVKQSYGALLSDIVYRIETPALFDPAVETTRAFTTALIQWDNSNATMGSAELSTLAARVQLTFETARAHAETVGLDHVPASARQEVERAAKAAQLAKLSHSESERAAALKQTMKILDAVRLYYMPSAAEAEAIAGGKQVLALPGRRRRPEED